MFYLNKIKNFCKKLPWLAAEHAFFSSLILFSISLILGDFIFYQYNVLVNKKEVKVPENPLRFKEETYQDVLKIWQERGMAFEKTGTKKYFDIFKAKPISQLTSQPASPKEGSNDYFLFKFYESIGEPMPLIEERAKIWEKMGFGSAASYSGEFYQNQKLLEALFEKELQK